LGLLGSYGYDIDSGISHHDDDYSDNEEKKLPQSSLDSKVADFLKEIDDLDAAMPNTNVKPKKKEKVAKKSEPENEVKQSASASDSEFSKLLCKIDHLHLSKITPWKSNK